MKGRFNNMTKSLTNVPIHLRKEDPEPLYAQIVTALVAAIDSGRLAPDTRLPSIRALAKELQVNTVTVVTAYRQLEQQGYVWSRVGSGTYVRSAPAAETTRQIYVPHHGINFASATPTPEIFPVADFKRLLNQVLDRDGGHAFGYQESQGWPPLREGMQQYLSENGIDTSVENIHIISGAQQGIDLAAKILVNQGDVIFVEGPTYHGAVASFQSRGAKIVPIPLEKDGPDLKSLERQLGRYQPRLFYAMPNFQNPTGYSYSAQKKQALLDLAQKHQFVIIEDDYLSELSYSGKARKFLKASDTGDRVMYIKSFSKILMPGLRLGLLVAPPQYNQGIGAAKQFSDISSSGLLQRTLDLFLREQSWQEHIQKMKEIYSGRHRAAINAIREHLPKEIQFSPPEGGLHLWLKLSSGLSGDELYRRCLREDILITPGSYFAPNSRYRQWFRLSYAAVTQEQISRGIALMGKIIREIDTPHTIQPLL